LATVGTVPTDQLDDLRAAIIKRVEARRQICDGAELSARRWRAEAAAKPSWYERWWPVASSSDDQPYWMTRWRLRKKQNPCDSSGDQRRCLATLARQAEDLPGLVLRPGRKRFYQYDDAACHVIGTLAMAGAKPDPEAANELRKYWPNDTAGSSGIEASVSLCFGERAARQTRATPETSWADGR